MASAVVTRAAAIPAEIYELPLGARVRWARLHAGLSQKQLAARIGSTGQHIHKVEKGTHLPRRRFRRLVAEALGVPYELFAEPPAPEHPEDYR